MSCLIAIDPGLRTTGWAMFYEDKISSCGLSRSTSTSLGDILRDHDVQVPAVPIGRAVIEKMQVYNIQRSKGDPADLVNLSILGGRLSSHAREVTFVEPKTWKGQRPKDAILPLIKQYLTEAEVMRMDSYLAPIKAKSLLHNAYEAVGIGLWALGRWPR